MAAASEKSNTNSNNKRPLSHHDEMESSSHDGNVDQIRDILFGSQMKDYEKKFIRLEDRILQEVTNLKDDTNKRLNGLESFIRTEIESLSAKMKNQKECQDDSVKALSDQMLLSGKAFTKTLTDFETNTDHNLRDLRQSILNQSKDLLDEIGKKHTESMNRVNSSFSELKEDKIDKLSLSGLFNEVALRLADPGQTRSSGEAKVIKMKTK